MDYVHGYDQREITRLQDQASTLVELLHSDTSYPAGNLVLEPGCGVGAQTITLCRKSPHALFTSIDVTKRSLDEAKTRIEEAGCTVEPHTTVALGAARLAIDLGLPMADSVMLQTARLHQATLWTQNGDLQGLGSVEYVRYRRS